MDQKDTNMYNADIRSPVFLKEHIRRLMDFYHPRVLDKRDGGYFGGLKDDGTIYDPSTRHLVDVCRHIYNFSTAGKLLADAELLDAARHGLDFLQTWHRMDRGGFAWILDRRSVVEPARHCYGHAFALLAASAAAQAELDGARALIDELKDLLETHFFEPQYGLYVDQIADGDWHAVDPYRGQNANMHMCEAMLAAYEATGDTFFLDRAELLAEKVCLTLSAGTDGFIWEHFSTDWSPDWDYNREDPKNLFRPYGYLPGHFVEWTKLLLLLHRLRPREWMMDRAQFLFDAAIRKGWDTQRGGFVYSFGPDGSVLDTDRYYWVLSEAIAGAALLGASGRADAWEWYDRFWGYAASRFIDDEFGGWFRVLDQDGRPLDTLKSPPAKTDYHPLSACCVALMALGAA